MLKTSALLVILLVSLGGAAVSLIAFLRLAWIAVEGASLPPYGSMGIVRHVSDEFLIVGVKREDAGYSLDMNPAPVETYIVFLVATAVLTLTFGAAARWTWRTAGKRVPRPDTL